MNVKPGDLAVVVNSRTHPDCNGMFVEVVAQVRHGVWRVRGHVLEAYAKRAGFPPHLHDDKLRPIRDNDGEDELLRIAGKPEYVAPREPVTQG